MGERRNSDCPRRCLHHVHNRGCFVYPCNVIRKHIADENEQLLQCEYESDRGGKLTVFFRVRNGKWVSFANEYVAEGVVV